MENLTISEKEFNKIFKDVQKEMMNSYIGMRIAKNEEEELEKEGEEMEMSENMEKDDLPPTEETPGEGHPGSPPVPGNDTPPDAGPTAAPSAPGEAEAGHQPVEAEQGTSPEELQQAYNSLSPEELEAHLMAAMAAYEAKNAQGGGVPGGEAPPMGAGAPPVPPSPAGAGTPPMMGKSEMPDSPERKGTHSIDSVAKAELINKKLELELKKSHKEMEDLKKSMNSQFENVCKAVETMFKPMQKGITGDTVIQPKVSVTKNLSKSEVDSKLRRLTKDPASLKKSDRDAIKDYYAGIADVNKIAHLFEDAK